MDEFLRKLADILEVDEVKPTDVLEDYPEWDSLSVLSAIAMIGSDYGINLRASDVRTVITAQSLYELATRKNGH